MPVLLLIVFILAMIKKIKPYDNFIDGTKSAIPIAFNLFPYLTAIFILTELFEISGLSNIICSFLSPVFKFLGVPNELIKLIIIKPFSGSGSLAVLSNIFTEYGVGSYISRCACVIYGSSETVFYVAAVYFANAKTKKLARPIIISLTASFFSCVFACFICKIL